MEAIIAMLCGKTTGQKIFWYQPAIYFSLFPILDMNSTSIIEFEINKGILVQYIQTLAHRENLTSQLQVKMEEE